MIKQRSIYLARLQKASLLSSDIDVLVVTDKSPAEVLKRLWEAGIKDPFEIHVATKEELKLYKAKAKLTRVK